LPGLRPLTLAELDAERDRRSALFAGSLYGGMEDVGSEMRQALLDAWTDGREEAFQKALERYPYLFQYATPTSGHHGVWAYPRPMIRAPAASGLSGLIPDFLVVTKNSLGYFWHIVELKRASTQFSNAAGDGLSTEGHKALVQCQGYDAHFRDYIDQVRSTIQVDSLVQPQDVILFMGDSEAETPAQTQVRGNAQVAGRIKVATYRRLLNGLEADLRHRAQA
jgi:hypothetical protein